MSGALHIDLREWQSVGPEEDPRLMGAALDDDQARSTAEKLANDSRLQVIELARGLRITTRSFVGSVTLGSLRISIRPKLAPALLLNLFRYAYSLRHLKLFQASAFERSEMLFQDLLIHQLLLEVEEILSRGPARRYIRTAGPLASPRGQVDIARYVRNADVATSTLPCVHYPRLLDNPFNQLLLAGLHLAVRVTTDPALRGRAHRLAGLLDGVSTIRLDFEALADVRRQMSRLVTSYRPCVDLIEILYRSGGIELEDPARPLELKGFLFDMNHFFQALLARFLREFLRGAAVREEHRLGGMVTYRRGFNPQGRRAFCPRPDYAIVSSGRVIGILDAKYRELWEHPLPRDMLYQLAIYALSDAAGGRATILYPTTHDEASEQIIDIEGASRAADLASIVVRPVLLPKLDDLIRRRRDPAGYRESRAYAAELAFGAVRRPPIAERSVITL